MFSKYVFIYSQYKHDINQLLFGMRLIAWPQYFRPVNVIIGPGLETVCSTLCNLRTNEIASLTLEQFGDFMLALQTKVSFILVREPKTAKKKLLLRFK